MTIFSLVFNKYSVLKVLDSSESDPGVILQVAMPEFSNNIRSVISVVFWNKKTVKFNLLNLKSGKQSKTFHGGICGKK